MGDGCATFGARITLDGMFEDGIGIYLPSSSVTMISCFDSMDLLGKLLEGHQMYSIWRFIKPLMFSISTFITM